MTGLEQALKFTLDYEGGYANNPADAGGETFRGISRRFHPEWEGWPTLDAMKTDSSFPSNATGSGPLYDMTTRFYETQFWDAVHGDELPVPLAMAVFDCAVHSGPGTAIRLLQSSLQIDADGVMGPVTVKAAHDSGQGGVVDYLTARAVYLDDIICNKPDQRVWTKNWCKRLFKLAAVVLATA